MYKRLAGEAVKFGLALTAGMLEDFKCYVEMLAEWNSKMNLTAIADPEDVLAKHFLDSLAVCAAYDIPAGAKLIDVGTGAGFPGIPLKIARPDIELTLLDSLAKRLDFLRALSNKLGQENNFVHARAEELAHDPIYRESYDIATARAVAALPLLCELCIGYLRVGGIFIAMKGPEAEAEREGSLNAIRLMGAELAGIKELDIPGAGRRNIVIIKKISQTSTGYPRTHKKMTRAPL